MPELIGYDDNGNPQFSFSDEDKLKGISVRSHNALLDPASIEADQSALPVDVTGVGAVPTNTTGFVAADKLLGLNGQERFQTWPERMVRSGVSLAHDVMTGELPVTTLRREDVTDIPSPQGATADSPFIGRLLNLSPIAADPRDSLIERAQDMAGLAGGATLGINPAEMTVASGMTKMAKNGAKLTPVEGNPFSSNANVWWHGSASGDLRGGESGLHLGTQKAATQALEARIGIPADGKGWTGNREYGKTLLAGKKTLEKLDPNGYNKTGFNVDVPEEDFFPSKELKYPDNSIMPMTVKPAVEPYRIKGSMNNTTDNPYEDFKANGYMRASLKKGNAKNGYFYKNVGEDSGSVSAVVPNGGHVSKILASDTQKPGMALSALEKPAPVFYSALENAVNNITANKMPADQWLGTLTNAKGVRPEEMEWTGLKDFLAEQKGPVTKEQVQQYLDANKIELKEVNKGEQLVQNIEDKIKRGEHLTQEDRNILDDAATKFSTYQLPGGENYRETLLTLPNKQLENLKKLKEEAHAASDAQLAGARMGVSKEAFNELEIAKDAAWKKVFDIENAGKPKSFLSSHWDEPNVLAHVRMNDRTIDGKKSLHLEEIQSDWHQIARDKGYAVSADKIEKLRPQFDKIDEKLLNSNDEQLLGHPEVDGMLKMAVDKKIITPDEAKIYKQVSDTAQTGAVPDAPFKKTWHELVLKRMLREAAEKGYDRLSWTPGEAQAARYDLSKEVKNINWTPSIVDKNSTLVQIRPNNGDVLKLQVDKNGKVEASFPASQGGQFEGKTLAEVIGKEHADKILAEDGGVLEGEGLKIGGEGMKGFYDQIIPKSLGKIGKEHGVKVKQGKLPLAPKGMTYQEILKTTGYTDEQWKNMSPSERKIALDKSDIGHPIHYIDIPQSLKDQALRKGFPLFSSGVMLSPVEQSPFYNQHKLIPVSHNPFE